MKFTTKCGMVVTFSRRDRGSKPPLPFRSLGNFIHPTLPVGEKPVMDSLALEKDTLKIRRTILEIMYLRFNVLSSV